ncbi:Protein of unknown function [Gryllus bimaculatus]|nr:Protein of unknown function [Gryllus bimaculatus]
MRVAVSAGAYARCADEFSKGADEFTLTDHQSNCLAARRLLTSATKRARGAPPRRRHDRLPPPPAAAGPHRPVDGSGKPQPHRHAAAALPPPPPPGATSSSVWARPRCYEDTLLDSSRAAAACRAASPASVARPRGGVLVCAVLRHVTQLLAAGAAGERGRAGLRSTPRTESPSPPASCPVGTERRSLQSAPLREVLPLSPGGGWWVAPLRRRHSSSSSSSSSSYRPRRVC